MVRIQRKDGIIYERNPMRTKETIPSREQYKQTLERLSTEGRWDCLIAVRLGCEMGMARIDICNAEVKNIDKHHKRSLWVEVSKLVKRGRSKEKPIYKMRSRDIPVNSNLYSVLMNYVNKDAKYILRRERGDISKPFDVQRINQLYEETRIPWSPHKSRHYFRTQLKRWMRENRCYDEEVIDALMGHQPRDAREMYGVIDEDYKKEIVDKVFG